MSNEAFSTRERGDLGLRLVYWLGLGLVIVGMLNSMPGIPGLDAAAVKFSGWKEFVVRKYPYEYFYPLAFGVMMLIVALKHSLWRDFTDKSPLKRRFISEIPP